MSCIKKIALLSLFLLLTVNTNAQSFEQRNSSNVIEIHNLTTEDGLPSNTVNKGMQDSRGFMWFPTRYGLSYFDGNKFFVIADKKNAFRISRIHHIAEDRNGKIWMKGSHVSSLIDILDVNTHNFEQAEKLYPSIKKIRGSPFLLFSDKKKNIYLVTDKGSLYKKDEGDNFKEMYRASKVDQMIRGRYFKFAENGFWFSLDKRNILYLSNEGKVKEIYSANNTEGIHLIGVDKFDNLLFSLFPQIGRSDKPDLIFKADTNGNVTRLNQQIFYTTGTLKDKHSRYFQDKLNGNIIRINISTGIELLTPDYKREVLIDANYISKYPGLERSLAAFDNLGNIWVSTATNGIYKISIRKNKFTSFLRNEDLPGDIGNSGTKARGIYIDENENLYLNSARSLYKISLNNEVQPVKVLNEMDGLSIREIDGQIYVGAKGLLIFGKDDKLLKQLEYKTNDYFTHTKSIGSFRGTDPNHNFWDVYKSDSGKLWVALNIGLFYYDEEKNNFIRYDLNLPGQRINAFQIFKSRDEKLWVTTSSGLFQFDEITGSFNRYWSGGEGKYHLPYNGFLNVHEDSDGVFWIATNGYGLIKWDRKSSEWQLYSVEDGLSTNAVVAILEDDYNKLWISSHFGLNSFNKKTEHINTYTIKDGLSSNEFTTISYHKSKDGRMYFGTVDGVNSFHPKDFLEEEKEYNVPLNIILFRQFEDESDKLIDKTKELLSTNKIVLHPGDKFFTLQFSLLNYEEGQNKYAYKFEGLDQDWNYIDENSIRISNLDYGNYELKVKGQNQKGRWSTAELSIDVEVLSPFYKQVWFIITSIFGLGLIVVSYLRYRVRLHEKERERLEFEVAKRTEKIEEDKKVIEKQAEELKELDKVKTRLFANISHELRTPLTLILGPLDAVLKGRYGDIQQKVKNTITRAAKNGNQLLRLIEQILDLSSLEAGKLIINNKIVSLTNLLNKIKNSFEPLAESKEINWYVKKEFEEDINFMLDDDKFGKIIYNLLSNAFKFTPAGGEVGLIVNKTENGKLLFEVKDTGKGIPPEDLPKIFDRFYQSSKMQESNIGGSGIGLAFAKELSIALGGDLEVESQIGEGTTFRLELPYKQSEVKSEEKIVEDSVIEEIKSEVNEDEEEVTLDKSHAILVVEDNLDLRDFISEVLSSDYTVLQAGDGEEALELLADKNNKIDFVVSDIMMPRMDGFELLEKLKSDEELKKLPLIMLTAKATTESKIKALRIGVDDYMYKPFVPEELLARVKNLLFHYEQRSELVPSDDGIDEAEERQLPEHEQLWLEKAEKLCRENIGDSRFNVSEFAYQMAISERQLQRSLKSLTGMTPNKYIREVKLQKAREMIDVGKYKTLSEVTAEIGFERTDYFVKIYTQRYGVAPQMR